MQSNEINTEWNTSGFQTTASRYVMTHIHWRWQVPDAIKWNQLCEYECWHQAEIPVPTTSPCGTLWWSDWKLGRWGLELKADLVLSAHLPPHPRWGLELKADLVLSAPLPPPPHPSVCVCQWRQILFCQLLYLPLPTPVYVFVSEGRSCSVSSSTSPSPPQCMCLSVPVCVCMCIIMSIFNSISMCSRYGSCCSCKAPKALLVVAV